MPTACARRRLLTGAIALTAALAGLSPAGSSAAASPSHGSPGTATPIKHLVVLFQENVPFDHYFGVYPTPPTRPASHDSRPDRARRPSTA